MATKRQAGLILSDNEMKKRYGAGLASSICLTEDNSLWLPSTVLPLNYQLGGGIAYGRILEEFGGESTGKSLLAKNFVSVAQSLGGVGLWADAEGTFAPYWAEQNGVDLSKLYLLPEENAVEVISDWMADMIITTRSKLVNNEPIVLVLDSTAALECMENINTSQVDAKAEMGTRAKAIYTMLRRRNKMIVKYGVCAIFINQLRQKVGASKYEDPDTTPGGAAMKFYASQRIGLYAGKQIKDDDEEKIGNNLYIRVKKNKIAPPRGRIQTQVFFTGDEVGYSKYAGLPEVLLKLGVVERKKARWYYRDKQIAHGDEKMLQILMDDEDLRRKLVKRSGINTPSKTRAKLEAIGKNLYPVSTKKQKANAQEEE